MRLVLLFLALLGHAALALAADAGSAEALMSEGRSAFTREDYAAAVRAFLGLLALPENRLSRDAREFLALAYERSGDIERARAEYGKYLEGHPEGEDAVRVRQRLASLGDAPAPQALRAPSRSGATASSPMVFGSLSQFYYHGNSTIEILPVAANPFDRTSLSLTDQSALITSLDLNARAQGKAHDSRVVFRDTNLQNFLEGQEDRNRVTAAYYDYRYKPADISARLGRQPPTGGGALTRFDGATAGARVLPGLRLNALAGEPVHDGLGVSSRRRLYGVNADLGPFAQRWSSNLYVVRQTVDGTADREATGMELRYFAPEATFMTLVDYDTLFREVNIVTLQGNWQSPWKTAFHLLLDRRKTPSLQTSNAVFGEATTSVEALLATYGEEELRRRAKAVTATASMGAAGLTHPVSKSWQLGADYRVMRISATEGTSSMPAIPDSGNVHTVSAQAIGTGVFSSRDVSLLSVSQISAGTYSGTALGATLRAPAGANWVFGASLVYYTQENDNRSTIKRVFGSLRTEYRLKANVTLEAEAGIDDSASNGEFSEERTDRRYFSLGYRWDF